MIFKSLQNIETSFRMIRMVALSAIAASVMISLYAIVTSHRAIEKSREKIYVLDNGKSLILALSQDMEQNRPIELRSHVKMFHELFFTLAPDNEAIKLNIGRALYLADKSGYNYYRDLAEAGYYKRLISTNTTQRIVIDSMECYMDDYPYYAKTYARQIITRQSNITILNLITTCNITEVIRSDNNPHGFMIETFNVEKNNVISTQKR